MVEDLLAAGGRRTSVGVSPKTSLVAQSASLETGGTSMRSSFRFGGKKHSLWRAVDQGGFVLEVLVQSHRNTKAAKHLMRKL